MPNPFESGITITFQTDIEANRDGWLHARKQRLGASEFPTLLGCHTYHNKEQLLRYFFQGKPNNKNEWVEKNLFKEGHEFENLFKDVKEIESVCILNEKYIASLDAVDFKEKAIYEIKSPRSDTSPHLHPEHPYVWFQLYMQYRMFQQMFKEETEGNEWTLNKVVITRDGDYSVSGKKALKLIEEIESKHDVPSILQKFFKDLDSFQNSISSAVWESYREATEELKKKKSAFEKENKELIERASELGDRIKKTEGLFRSPEGYVSISQRESVDIKKFYEWASNLNLELPEGMIKKSEIVRIILNKKKDNSNDNAN